VVVAVVREAEGAERAVHAVEAVHVALALVRVRVDPALDEEARGQQRLQPRRPPLVLGAVVVALAASLQARTVHTHSVQKHRHRNQSRTKKQRATQEQEESINYHGASALESERRRVIYCHLVAAEPRRMRASGRERGRGEAFASRGMSLPGLRAAASVKSL